MAYSATIMSRRALLDAKVGDSESTVKHAVIAMHKACCSPASKTHNRIMSVNDAFDSVQTHLLRSLLNMELRQLRYFLAAGEEQHFGRAADRLHITRPAISIAISNLENEVGVKLFERISHSVKLTPAGHSLLSRVKLLMVELDDAVETARIIDAKQSGVINLGYGALTLISGSFRLAIQEFEKCSATRIALHEINSEDQFNAIAAGSIDAGFIHLGPNLFRDDGSDGVAILQDRLNLEFASIKKLRLGLVVPKHHRLANKISIQIADAAGERFVVSRRSSYNPRTGFMKDIFQEAGMSAVNYQEVTSIATLLSLVGMGAGVGISVADAEFPFSPEVRVIPFRDEQLSSLFVLAWAKGHYIQPLGELVSLVQRRFGREGDTTVVSASAGASAPG